MNKQKTYIRVGRCFKEVPNYIGMFYDGKIFTTERTDRSYAICYDQRGTTCYLAKIEFEPGTFTFDDAVAITGFEFYSCYLPTREQAVIAFSRCPILRTETDDFAWTREERSKYYAWDLSWKCGIVDYYPKNVHFYVRLFFEITIEI